jgi:tRNA G18 (ribose-2'-O)-methylase SpoU
MIGGWRVQRLDGETRREPPPGIGPCVVLDNVRSAYNVGSIMRTCEGAGVRHLYLCGISAYPPNPKVLKTSLGAEKTLAWSHHLSTLAVVKQLREEGLAIISLELTDRSVPYTEIEYPSETALVFGHETGGVAAPLLDCSDHVVEIPLVGRKNSLNVSVSVGVILFELLRRRWADR